MRINRSLTGAGSDTEGPDAGELVIVCCVSACGLAATGLLLLGPPNAAALCLMAAAGLGLALWATAGLP
ncbi:Uncharacterised protein [Starkeya nomas]|uniref:Uncharacterized protein n=1 Tax=Starkeya nomas TaxID=2666134 RepID=A0A5S9Q4A9_9HYPH|nr:hypothetical protein [Starkeya nomas]CAA0112520.1 Uncharacterised protein [Starkeya nomas]